MAESFEEELLEHGDIVQLKSGGPRMVVESVSSAAEARCRWFDGGESRADVFVATLLRKVKDADPEEGADPS